MLRSCYSTRMVFGTDENVSYRIKWFFCQPTAKPLGFPTPFVSRNWTDHGIDCPVGELLPSPRPWRDGSIPIVVPGTSGPCGDLATWSNGYPGPNPPGLQRNDLGFAWCCGLPGLIAGQPLFNFYPDLSLALGVYWGKDYYGSDYFGSDYWG